MQPPVLLLLLAVGALALAGCGQQAALPEIQPAAPVAVSSNPPPENPSPMVAAAPADYSKLKGRWERPDGGYVLEIRDMAADGKADAGYFNPSPIKVESAHVSSEAGVLKVFVTLRDANYPGCTYTLAYDPQADQLFGKYYQAAMQETYDVTFARLK